MAFLELKIPPPVVALLVATGMWKASFLAPLLAMPYGMKVITVAMLAFVGAGLLVAGAVSFHYARTTVNPFKPQDASSLVTSGVYRITRNPMYTGLVLVLLAWAVFLSALWPFLGPPVFILYVTRFQIQPEEKILVAIFGETYQEYTNRVRRWL